MKKTLTIIFLFITFLLSQTPKTEPKETTGSFFDLYDQNRKEQIPNYITLDFILTANYLFKQQSVTAMEEGVLYADFKSLAFGLQETLLKNYNPFHKEPLAYVLVLNKLLGHNVSNAPKDALNLAQQELALIAKHQGISISPLAKVKLDYSQYKVRGKYTQSQNLRAYFLALRFMTYTPFMVNAHAITGVTPKMAQEQIKNAQTLAKALKPYLRLYNSIENRLKRLSGAGDDLSLAILANQSENAIEIQNYLNGLQKYPKISERILDTNNIQKEAIPKASLALKLFPSRFTPDSYIFSQLTYPNVGILQGEKDNLTSYIDGKAVRGYPTIGDIGAVLVGLNPKEQYYQGYQQKVKALRKELQFKTDNLYAYDFSIYKKLLQQKRINSFQGYYTQSRYIMNLYQKQSYTGGLKSIFLDERKAAYLEPKISEVLDLLIAQNRLLPKSERFIEILKQLKALDKKQNQFTPKEVAFLNNLDSKFKSILDDKDTPIEVDIHTNPVEGKVMYQVLKEPFVKRHDGFRGAGYHWGEVVRGR